MTDGAPAIPVSQLNRLARDALERALPPMWISGEISNLTRAASGHVYFTLKDAHAQVRCALWRSRAQLLNVPLSHGQKVEVRALPTLYESRGEFQLNVEAVRQAGVGSLYEAFLRLRDQLAAEGLFDPTLKRPIPRYPRAIGIVTSTAAAALRDVLAALRRRAGGVTLCIYPAAVQGEAAPAQLQAALAAVSARAEQDRLDVLLLVRGGGSMEDLWAFNDPELARAIRRCPVPVICGVGHETDFSIADFAADLRAATPTAAAELASAGYHELGPALAAHRRALERAIMRCLERAAQRLDRAQLRLLHPAERIGRARERLATMEQRLRQAASLEITRRSAHSDALALRLAACRPSTAPLGLRLDGLEQRLRTIARTALGDLRQRVEGLADGLRHLAPESVLSRGYSITRDSEGRILRRASDVEVGAALTVQLAVGRLGATVDTRDPEARWNAAADLSAGQNPD